MLGSLALWSVCVVVLADRAAIVKHADLGGISDPDDAVKEPESDAPKHEATQHAADPASATAGDAPKEPESDAPKHEAARHAADPASATGDGIATADGIAKEPESKEVEVGKQEAKPGDVKADPEAVSHAGPAGSAIKELDYASMRAVTKELAATVKDMVGRVSGELTQKANDAAKAGAAYAALLKEQNAGHAGFKAGVKTFRSTVSDRHHKETQSVRKALQSGTAGGHDAEQQATAEGEAEADMLKKALIVTDPKVSEDTEKQIESEAKSEKKDYDPKAMHVFLRWQKDVDLNLYMQTPDSAEVETAFNNNPEHTTGVDYVVKAARNREKKDGWSMADISSAPGAVPPRGRYHFWATYASGVPGKSAAAPEEDENVRVPFEAEFKLGEVRQLVKDTIVWEKGNKFNEMDNSLMIFELTVTPDHSVEWSNGDFLDPEEIVED